MKIKLTLSPAQLKHVAESLVHTSLYDKTLKKDADWTDLQAVVRMANDEVNNDVPRLANYRVIK